MNRKTFSLFQVPDGRWRAQVYCGTNPVTGKPIRKSKCFSQMMTREQAALAASEWVNHGALPSTSGQSKRLDCMLAAYLDHGSAYNLAPQTIATYRSCLNQYIAPTLGDINFDELTAEMVSDAWSVLMKPSKKDEREAVSSSTLHKTHCFMRGAYNVWLKQGLCNTNPMVSAPTPRLEMSHGIALHEMDFLEVQKSLLSALSLDGDEWSNRSHRSCAFAAWLALVTGMRVGEVCSLRLSDVSFVKKQISVNSTMIEKPYLTRSKMPKTASSIRNITITADDCKVIQDHIAWNKQFRNVGSTSPLISTTGAFCSPSAISKGFKSLVRKLKLDPKLTFHSLRHTHATWLLQSGVDVRTVSERLGHSDVTTTLKVYAHVLPGRDEAAANTFNQVLNELNQQE